jgi:hypothetical protein
MLLENGNMRVGTRCGRRYEGMRVLTVYVGGIAGTGETSLHGTDEGWVFADTAHLNGRAASAG